MSVFSTVAPSFIFLPTDGSTFLKNNKTGWGWPPCGWGIVITQITFIAAGVELTGFNASDKRTRQFTNQLSFHFHIPFPERAQRFRVIEIHVTTSLVLEILINKHTTFY